jgi:hypothetical protein
MVPSIIGDWKELLVMNVEHPRTWEVQLDGQHPASAGWAA